MKNGFKHKTGAFGSDAERYVGRLFGMVRNPHNQRRPDLLSPYEENGLRLTLEVKSGLESKGVMVVYQLQYALNSEEDYKKLFGENVKRRSLFPNESPKVAYYYDVINRTDELPASALDRPFATVRIKWGDQYLVPHEYAFHAFAIARAIRTGETLGESTSHIRAIMKRDFSQGTTGYEGLKKDPQSWQNLMGRDILAVFQRDLAIATEGGRERIRMLRDVYDTDHLKRISIPGPNRTTIYLLAEPEHEGLFEGKVRSIVGENTSSLERIARERKRCEGLLEKIVPAKRKNVPLLFGGSTNGEHKALPKSLKDLSQAEIDKLASLSRWADMPSIEFSHRRNGSH